MAHYITLYARSAEEVTKARDALKQAFPTAMLNYHHDPELTSDFAERKGYQTYKYALTLMFRDAGPEVCQEVQAVADEMFGYLQRYLRGEGYDVERTYDNERGCGWRQRYAERFIIKPLIAPEPAG